MPRPAEGYSPERRGVIFPTNSAEQEDPTMVNAVRISPEQNP